MVHTVETERLLMRRIRWKDYEFLCGLLGDRAVMYAWEHAFTRQEAEEWLEQNLIRYERDGYSYYLAESREAGMPVGVCGLLEEDAGGMQVLGVGYIFHRAHWGLGYATEAASAWMEYAFSTLQAPRLTAQIRPENTASIKVAERLGMEQAGRFVKQYRGKEMPHILYAKNNPAADGGQ